LEVGAEGNRSCVAIQATIQVTEQRICITRFCREVEEARITHEASASQIFFNHTSKGSEMNNLQSVLINLLRSFARDEDGAQVVEYALIIAVVSIALVVALRALTLNGGGFATFIGRVTTCLTTAVCV
jgi:pilus assembly protein Flp/PilA